MFHPIDEYEHGNGSNSSMRHLKKKGFIVYKTTVESITGSTSAMVKTAYSIKDWTEGLLDKPPSGAVQN